MRGGTEGRSTFLFACGGATLVVVAVGMELGVDLGGVSGYRGWCGCPGEGVSFLNRGH